MAYSITNISNTYTKKDERYNKTVTLTVLEGITHKKYTLKPGENIVLDIPFANSEMFILKNRKLITFEQVKKVNKSVVTVNETKPVDTISKETKKKLKTTDKGVISPENDLVEKPIKKKKID